jgi:hypothetical protein
MKPVEKAVSDLAQAKQRFRTFNVVDDSIVRSCKRTTFFVLSDRKFGNSKLNVSFIAMSSVIVSPRIPSFNQH